MIAFSFGCVCVCVCVRACVRVLNTTNFGSVSDSLGLHTAASECMASDKNQKAYAGTIDIYL